VHEQDAETQCHNGTNNLDICNRILHFAQIALLRQQ
jgi:hypothetical protein